MFALFSNNISILVKQIC